MFCLLLNFHHTRWKRCRKFFFYPVRSSRDRCCVQVKLDRETRDERREQFQGPKQQETWRNFWNPCERETWFDAKHGFLFDKNSSISVMNGFFVIVRREARAFAIQSSNLKVLLIEKILAGDLHVFITRINNAFEWREPRICTCACMYVYVRRYVLFPATEVDTRSLRIPAV